MKLKSIINLMLIIGLLVIALPVCAEEVDVDYYGESNVQCGGCCSWHGGVACGVNGETICADGSQLSDTCSAKGCEIVGCGDNGLES